MNHINLIYQKIRGVKRFERIELIKAVIAYGGTYKFRKRKSEPVVFITTGHSSPKQVEIRVTEVVLQEDELWILGFTTVSNESVTVEAANVVVGDIVRIVERIPKLAINQPILEERFFEIIARLCVNDLKQLEYDVSNISVYTIDELVLDLMHDFGYKSYLNDLEHEAEFWFGLQKVWDSWFDSLTLEEKTTILGLSGSWFFQQEIFEVDEDECKGSWNDYPIEDKVKIYRQYKNKYKKETCSINFEI